MSRWTAVLLAGSRPGGDPFAQAMGVKHKALIPVAGEAMILKPLRTLLASPDVARVLVLAQEPAPLRASIPASKRVAFRESEGTIAQTLSQLLANRGTQFPVVVTTADHALLDGAMLFEFLAKSAGADLAVGVVAKSKMTTWFPTAKRTWIPFRGDSFSGANLFAFGTRRALAAIELWRAVEQDRKKGWRVLSALGPGVLLGAGLRLRTAQQCADAIGRRLGISIRTIEMSDPVAAIDVDKPADLELAEDILAGRL